MILRQGISLSKFKLHFMTHPNVQWYQDRDLHPDPWDLDLGSQDIIDPSLHFVERSTGIIDLINQFVMRSTEIIDLHHIIVLYGMVISKQITSFSFTCSRSGKIAFIVYCTLSQNYYHLLYNKSPFPFWYPNHFLFTL